MAARSTEKGEPETDFSDHRMTGLEAFFTSVIAGVVFFALGMGILGAIQESSDFFGLWAGIPIFALIVAGLALPVMLAMAATIGLGITAILSRRRLERPWSYPLAGSVTGLAGFRLMTFTIVGFEDPFPYPATVLAAASGALCGWLWWKLAREPISYDGAYNG